MMDEFIFNGNLHMTALNLESLGVSTYSQAVNVAKALLVEYHSIRNQNDICNKGILGLKYDNSLISNRGKYYISIKKSSLVLLCFLLDVKIETGGLLTLLSALGLLAPGIQKLSDYEGERCIIVEIINRNDKTGKSSLLDKYSHFCNKPYMNCKFKQCNDAQQSCTCTHQDTFEILQKLNKLNILKRTKEGFKYIPE